MNSRIYFALTGGKDTRSHFVHFCEAEEIDSLAVQDPLWWKDVAIFEVDGASIHNTTDLFQAFAKALRMPKGWYGSGEQVPNADAFLEYLVDVHEWVPANGHIVLIRQSELFWQHDARIAGMLVEWWQLATHPRGADIHLVFVW